MSKKYNTLPVPDQISEWRGEVSNPLNQSDTIFIALHYPPNRDSAYDTGYFDKFVPIASLPDDQQLLARTALEVTCTLELSEDRSRVVSVKKYDFTS